MPEIFAEKKVTLVQKLILSYVAIVFFSVAATVFSFFGLHSLNGIVLDIARKDLAFIKSIEGLRNSIQTQERTAAKFSVLKSPEFREIFDLQQKEFLSSIATLQKTDSSQLLEQLSANYRDFSQKAAILFSGHSEDFQPLKTSADAVNDSIEALSVSRQAILNAKLMEADHERETTVKWTILLSCIGFAFALFVMFFFSITFSSSIKKLKRATHRIAEGDFDYDPRIPAGDEIGDLSQDFSRMAMRLKELEQISLDASPLTRLPGNIAIERVLTKKLQGGETFAVCYADLDNFKAYNDRYGYIKGSDLIKMTGEVIYEAVKKYTDNNSFVGHIGGDDFIIIVAAADAENICKEVIRDFTEKVPEFYSREDLDAGCIEAMDRYGIARVFPIMTISIAIVMCKRGEYDSAVKIARTAAEIKEYAKGATGSNYFFDRRKKAR